MNERESIIKHLKKFQDFESKLQLEADTKLENAVNDVKPNEDMSTILDLAMRDQVLEIEERIFFGTLGSLKIRDRAAWQKAISDGGYDKHVKI